jgi:RNA polymerase sigma factor (sigma-70 family)
MSRIDEEAEREMKLLLAREPAALRRFWQRERPIVYGICARVLGTGADASDVADAVMVDFMFDCVKRLENAGTMGAYVRLMAARRAIRRREQKSKNVASELHARVDESRADPDHSIHLAKAESTLAECIRKLTPKAQEALRLRYSGELTQGEIGAIVGGSKQYIGRLLSQSIEKLRACLGAAGFEIGAVK